MKFELLAGTSDRVRRRGARLQKIAALQELLQQLPQELADSCVSMLAGRLPMGKIGIGGAAIRAALDARESEESSEGALTVQEVLDTLLQIQATSGAGSKQKKHDLLTGVFSRCGESEASFLARLLFGELRQGALEGVMIDALARHLDIELARVRRAVMLAGSLPDVATALLAEGEPALERFRIEVFRPLQPMLAQPAESPEEAMAGMESAAIDLKLDGVRVQVHKRGSEVRLYSRRLHDVTRSVPELVEEIQLLQVEDLIADGETFLPGRSGAPLPFQVTMGRFGRKVDVDAARAKAQLELRLFDLLYSDGEDFTERPLRDRWAELRRVAPEGLVVPQREIEDAGDADAFFEEALEDGHEGAMIKDLDSPYRAGARSSGWRKLKSSHTLDLVVLAAEWGSGRRQGWLSNLHLGARAQDGSFVMLGKTFKGLTDELLEWQTKELLARRLDPSAPTEPGPGHWVVEVRPELVVEIAFNNVQASQQYPGGMALRFARVKGYRSDKAAAEADTIEAVREVFEAEQGRAGD